MIRLLLYFYINTPMVCYCVWRNMSILCRRAYGIEKCYAFATTINNSEQYLQLEYSLVVSNTPSAIAIAVPSAKQDIRMLPTEQTYLDLFSHLTSAWSHERSSGYSPAEVSRHLPVPTSPFAPGVERQTPFAPIAPSDAVANQGGDWQTFVGPSTDVCGSVQELYECPLISQFSLLEDDDVRSVVERYYARGFSFVVIGINGSNREPTPEAPTNSFSGPETSLYRARIAVGITYSPSDVLPRNPDAPLYIPTRMIFEGKDYAKTMPFAHVVHTVNATIGECMCRVAPERAFAWDRLPGRTEHVRSLRVLTRLGMFSNHDLYLPRDTQLPVHEIGGAREYLACDGSRFVDRTRLGIVRFRQHNLHTLCIVNGGYLRTPASTVCSLFDDGHFEFVDSDEFGDEEQAGRNDFIWLLERPYEDPEQLLAYKIFPRELFDVGQLTLLSFRDSSSW